MELEIGVGHGAGNYVVRVIRAPTGGEPSGSLKLDVEEILSMLPVLEATVLAQGFVKVGLTVRD